MSLSGDVLKCLGGLLTQEDLCDFTVEIDDVSIKCHRVILGACSPFFLGLLRSGMKEANEGRVVLQNISVSTFQLILKTLYTGEDVLSLDNFIEFWHVVDMLQIGFLIKSCETYAIKNIQFGNFSKIFSTANMFDSQLVISSVKQFIIQNCVAIYAKKLYLEMSFDEIDHLISSHDLQLCSEYLVLDLVLSWVEYKPIMGDTDTGNISNKSNKKVNTSEADDGVCNSSQYGIQASCIDDTCADVNDKNIVNGNMRSCVNSKDKESTRSSSQITVQSDSCSIDSRTSEHTSNARLDRLEELMKRVRTYNISQSSLVNVLVHRVIKHNDQAQKIIFSAILNQTSFRHGQWPTSGLYRKCNEYGNYGVYYRCGKGTLEVVDPEKEGWYEMQECHPLRHYVQLVTFDRELYATGVQHTSYSTGYMFVYSNNSWVRVLHMPGKDFLLASNENYIYITNVASNVIYRLNPKCTVPSFVEFTKLPEGSVVTHVMSYRMCLVFFCSETINDFKATAVHMLDLQDRTWTRLDNFAGPAKNIISFRNDNNHFVMQSNGNLWILNKTAETITFSRVAKLWDIETVIYGAVVYGEKLLIFYHNSEGYSKDSFTYKLDNHFNTVTYLETNESSSNFIPTVLPKSCLGEATEQSGDSDDD